jgi:DNA-binding transcriptional LysR family regulator
MELSQLKYFYTAARLEHITRAAEELHMVQPALTAAIRRLEKELGVELFTRKGRQVSLSKYGEHMMHRLEPILASLDSLPEELRMMSTEDKQTIRLRILAGTPLVTKAVIHYKTHEKDINFKIFQQSGEYVADIEIFSAGCGPEDISAPIRTSNSYIFREDILLAVPRESKYADMESIQLAMVKDEEFVCLGKKKKFRNICDAYCMQAGFTPKVCFECDNDASILGLVVAGGYISFWPQYTWEDVDKNSIALIPISAPQCRREITIRCNADNKRHPEATKFFDYLISAMNVI